MICFLVYNWCEVKAKMWVMNLGKPVNIPVLNEAMAIDLGANLLGEGIIFVIAAAALIFEYNRWVFYFMHYKNLVFYSIDLFSFISSTRCWFFIDLYVHFILSIICLDTLIQKYWVYIIGFWNKKYLELALGIFQMYDNKRNQRLT